MRRSACVVAASVEVAHEGRRVERRELVVTSSPRRAFLLPRGRRDLLQQVESASVWRCSPAPCREPRFLSSGVFRGARPRFRSVRAAVAGRRKSRSRAV